MNARFALNHERYPAERRGEPGEAKAFERKITMTSLVLGQTLEVFPYRPLRHRQLAGASRYRPIAFDSEGLPLRELLSGNDDKANS